MLDHREQLPRFGWYAAAWIPVAAMYLIGFAFVPNTNLTRAASMALGVTSTAGLLAWPIWERIERIGRLAGWRRIATHVLLATAFAIAHAGLLALVLAMSAHREEVWPIPVWDAFGTLWLYALMMAVMLSTWNSARARHSQAIVRAAEADRLRADALRVGAELRSVRAHLNPHFLFNALNAIAASITTDPDLARAMLVRLGTLLRSLLELDRRGADLVALDEELAFVRDYLHLEELRMGERLIVEEDIDADARECALPPLTVQPLVENAIRHGIFPRPGPGAVRIAAHVASGRLRIVVSDDGLGAQDADLEHAAGLGLRSVRQRMQHQFGEMANVRVSGLPGSGVTVTLDLPATVA